MLKITLIKIIFQIKKGDINISEKTINKSNKYLRKKQINPLNFLLFLCKVFFIIYIYYQIIKNNLIATF